MELMIDPDVKAVVEFMQGNMPAAKLVSVAAAVAALAPILWGAFEAESVATLRLVASPPSADHAARIRPCAKSPDLDSAYAGGGSVAAAF
jgi:hypothetical protein